MDLNLLRLFVEVADSKGFSAAARKLGQQRSSVSRGVAAVEEELGVQLFNRSTRKISLTTAGETLYEKLSPRFSAIDDALDEMAEEEEEASGLLRITTSQDLAVAFLPDFLSSFTQRYPKVQVQVMATNRFVDLVAEGVDAAIRPTARELPDSSLVALKLSGLSGNVFGAPSYLARAGTPATLAEAREKHTWVQGPGFKQLGWGEVDHRIIGDDMLFARACTVAGMGLGGLPDYVAQCDVEAGRLIRLFSIAAFHRGALFLLHPPYEHYPKKLKALRDALRDYIKSHPMVWGE
jgi:DNA-binding transcriptional LysR family regulator